MPLFLTLTQLLQLRLSLFQPQSHFHLPHQRDAFVEMLLRQWQITASPINFSQTNLAMRYERTHSELFSESKSVEIVVLRLFVIKGIFARRNLTKQPKSVRLVSSLFMLTGKTQGALCSGTGIQFPTGQYIRFTQPDGPQRLDLLGPVQDGALDGLLQQGDCLSSAPGERIGVT